jgi:hypothetical protein
MPNLNSLRIISLIFISFFLLTSCGTVEKLKQIHKPVDLRKEPLDPDERAKKNIAEGRGISLKNLGGGGKTNYEFSTSNPLWRATLDIIDFIPLTTVDYSGGLIISDWYNDGKNQNEAIKISVRFMSNEIRSDSLKIQVFKKNCSAQNNCATNLIVSSISEELIRSILAKAVELDKNKINN